ncbi:hypothetical protein BD779DRAFT_163881 [Infundibulicybe gibba]|nr:hypothetical protein BD779DRAFT_163881 [Infundibulicybe gibba]
MDNYHKPSHWDNSEPAAILYFDSNDMKQTNIYAESGSRRLTAYSVSSNRDVTVTTINRAYDSTPLAIVERREIFPDMITLQGERRRMKKWLKLSGSSVFPAFFEHHGETYLWKCSIVGQLSFYNANRPEIPIAWFETSKKRVIEGVLISPGHIWRSNPRRLEFKISRLFPSLFWNRNQG